jgi:deazaflavin-dependent oxidoreductase (nitroreductase family)
MSAFNEQVIADFNTTRGKPGGHFQGKPVLLLHAIGAKSGIERTTPLMFLHEGDGPWYVFASYGGAPNDPAWFRNIVAQPDLHISVGDGQEITRVPVRARVLDGKEREQTYARQAELYPQFAGYEQKTTRTIPVVELTRR